MLTTEFEQHLSQRTGTDERHSMSGRMDEKELRPLRQFHKSESSGICEKGCRKRVVEKLGERPKKQVLKTINLQTSQR